MHRSPQSRFGISPCIQTSWRGVALLGIGASSKSSGSTLKDGKIAFRRRGLHGEGAAGLNLRKRGDGVVEYNVAFSFQFIFQNLARDLARI